MIFFSFSTLCFSFICLLLGITFFLLCPTVFFYFIFSLAHTIFKRFVGFNGWFPLLTPFGKALLRYLLKICVCVQNKTGKYSFIFSAMALKRSEDALQSCYREHFYLCPQWEEGFKGRCPGWNPIKSLAVGGARDTFPEESKSSSDLWKHQKLWVLRDPLEWGPGWLFP